MTSPARRDGGFWRAWRTRAPVWRVAVVTVGILGLVVGGSQLLELRAASDASCSSSCHAPSSKHLHAELACTSCHDAPKGMVAARLVLGEIFGSKSPPKHGETRSKTCERCHVTSWTASVARLSPTDARRATAFGEVGDRAAELWAAASVTQGHRAHGPRAPGETECLSCHRGREHGENAPDATCKGCHDEAAVHVTPLGEDEPGCTSCHGFLGRRPANTEGVGAKLKEPVVGACARCHGSPAMTPATGREPTPAHKEGASIVVGEGILHGTVACGDCHSPHTTNIANSGHNCRRCHDLKMPDQDPTTAVRFRPNEKPKPDVPGHKNCEGCHAPHSPQKLAIAACKNCHPEQALARGESTTALRHDNCASCHVPHTWAAERSGCIKCHKDIAAKVLALGPKKHNECGSCHDPHKSLPDANVCTTCHEDKRSHLSQAPAGHHECKGCHDPHANKAAARDACPKCHGKEQAQVGIAVPMHGQVGCLGCHQPHNSPLPPPGRCSTCHPNESTLAATSGTPPKHQQCGSCHQPHTFKIAVPAQACSKCHATLLATGSHQGPCLDCHKQHGPPRPAPTVCPDCHKTVDNAKLVEMGHKRCNFCHQPHKRSVFARTMCRTCHADAHAGAATWPAGSPHAEAGRVGTDACTSCHHPHNFKEKTACQSCHVSQASTFGVNKHKCESCHSVAQARPAPTATENGQRGWWTACNKCHQAQVQAVATRRAEKHRQCVNCHTNHQPGKPQCLTCHQAITTSGVHIRPEHRQCTKCHESHATSNIDRAKCTACHDNKKDHQPQAPRCQACHLFK